MITAAVFLQRNVTAVMANSTVQQRCTESENFDSDSAPASAEHTATPKHLKFWCPTPA